ncbi:hypothetical protein K2173_028418 [Erythroxylum novogranatense]|uniref:Uncharacterized protein n=1 Tax=Erythroxylum novogranatense TaxID=1862640 RepID=A0AAV8U1T4_9ROSI|nr:hypothetical protein K2173_028418 [Erythroxylum novogranatense]
MKKQGDLIQQLTTRMDQLTVHNKMLETQIAQQAASLRLDKGKLPAQSEAPKETKAVVLRSGKVLEPMVQKNKTEKESAGTDQDAQPMQSDAQPVQQSPEPEKYIPPPPYKSPIPFPQRFHRAKLDQQFENFVGILKKLYVNIPFTEALTQMPTYVNVSLLPLSICQKLDIGELKPTTISLQLADRSIKFPIGILENVPLKVGILFIPVDFVVLEMKEDTNIPIILGRPFLATAGAIIDVKNGKMTLRVGEEEIEFNLGKAMKVMDDKDSCLRVDLIDTLVRRG